MPGRGRYFQYHQTGVLFGSKMIENNSLSWKVENNEKIQSFLLYASHDGLQFEKINEVVASGNNGSEEYNYQDKNVLGSRYYKVEAKLLDETMNSSQIIYLERNNNSEEIELTCVPNPTLGDITVYTNHFQAGNYQLEIIDMKGRIVLAQNINLNEGRNTIPFEVSDLANSIYFLKISNHSITRSIKIVKQ